MTDDLTLARQRHELTLQLHRQQTERIEALRRANEALMNADVIRTGDEVLVSAHGQTDVPARVVLASENGRSLMLEFPGGLFRVAGGAYIGYMPVLLGDDGRWTELINGRAITVNKSASHHVSKSTS